MPGPGIVALALGLVTACAKVAPPPGGAEDLEPPEIVTDAVQPPPGSGGVEPGAPVVIVFSERPDRRSVLRALRIRPRVDFREVSWSTDTLRLFPDPAWAPGRNTVLRISRGAEDRRGNALRDSFFLQFTTKDVADSGEISGRVWAGREREGDRRVTLMAFEVADSLDPAVSDPHAVTEAASDGRFVLEGLDTSREWRVVAILDRDDDLLARERGEAMAIAPGVLRFERGEARADAGEFLVGTLDSVGTIRGEVVADSADVAFAQAIPYPEPEGGADRAALEGAQTGAGGPFRSRALRGGGRFEIGAPTGAQYQVRAFVDVDGDSLPGENERQEMREEAVSLRFTTEASGLRFDLSTPEPEESLELEGTAPEEVDSSEASGGNREPNAADPVGEGESQQESSAGESPDGGNDP